MPSVQVLLSVNVSLPSEYFKCAGQVRLCGWTVTRDGAAECVETVASRPLEPFLMPLHINEKKNNNNRGLGVFYRTVLRVCGIFPRVPPGPVCVLKHVVPVWNTTSEESSPLFNQALSQKKQTKKTPKRIKSMRIPGFALANWCSQRHWSKMRVSLCVSYGYDTSAGV